MTKLSEDDVLSLAVIGCGRIAQTHLQAISTIPECKLTAVVDLREQTANSVSEQFGFNNGCKPYSDYRNVLDDNHIDAVVICSPPNTHAEIATYFLEKGIHVMCEKPLAINCNDASLIVKKAEENDSIIMMASKFRYVEDVIKAKGIIESGVLGDIILFENVFCSKVDMTARWNADKEISGGGVLIDNGCHSVDIARYLLGPIVNVQAEEGKRVQNIEVEDTALLYFRTQSGTMGTVALSWSIHKEQESFIDIYGTEGVLSIGWKCSKYRQSEKMKWVNFGNGYDKLSAFTGQINNFIASIKGMEKPMINSKDSLESVKVITAAYQSVNMNKWIKVDNNYDSRLSVYSSNSNN